MHRNSVFRDRRAGTARRLSDMSPALFHESGGHCLPYEAERIFTLQDGNR